jgi:ankyrin repeat protein
VWRVCLVISLTATFTGCGCSIATTSDDQRTPLEKAAQQSNLAEVRRLLDSGTDPNAPTVMFGSPLHAAAFGRANAADTVRLLISAGANPNGRRPEPNRCWVSPLFHAAVSGDVESATVLLDAGASITEQPHCSQWNAGWLEPGILNLLVSRGLDLKRVDSVGRNQLQFALAPPLLPRTAAIEYLIRAGVPINARDKHGRTPLACWKEPRDFETHWFRTWLLERLAEDSYLEQQRRTRKEITTLLTRSGAIT